MSDIGDAYGRPPKGAVGTAERANAQLAEQLASGMNLVVSYWSGRNADAMGWLDQPCTEGEKAQWGCRDQWTDRRAWPWTCERKDRFAAPECGGSFRLSNLRVERT